MNKSLYKLNKVSNESKKVEQENIKLNGIIEDSTIVVNMNYAHYLIFLVVAIILVILLIKISVSSSNQEGGGSRYNKFLLLLLVFLILVTLARILN
jgi:heme/copper-type cytochrome/quinol oxidase subunit 2